MTAISRCPSSLNTPVIEFWSRPFVPPAKIKIRPRRYPSFSITVGPGNFAFFSGYRPNSSRGRLFWWGNIANIDQACLIHYRPQTAPFLFPHRRQVKAMLLSVFACLIPPFRWSRGPLDVPSPPADGGRVWPPGACALKHHLACNSNNFTWASVSNIALLHSLVSLESELQKY